MISIGLLDKESEGNIGSTSSSSSSSSAKDHKSARRSPVAAKWSARLAVGVIVWDRMRADFLIFSRSFVVAPTRASIANARLELPADRFVVQRLLCFETFLFALMFSVLSYSVHFCFVFCRCCRWFPFAVVVRRTHGARHSVSSAWRQNDANVK